MGNVYLNLTPPTSKFLSYTLCIIMARSNDNHIHLTNDYHVRDLSGHRTPLLSHHPFSHFHTFIVSSDLYRIELVLDKNMNNTSLLNIINKNASSYERF